MWPSSSQVGSSGFESYYQKEYLESYTIDDFSESLRLSSADLHNLKLIFHSVEQGDLGVLSAIGVKVSLLSADKKSVTWYLQDSELGDMTFFIQKLIRTGFLDTV